MSEAARQAVERAARESYGRLLAFLAARSHDLAAAEDALSDAFRSALETWPRDGVPDKPEAWLLTAARRRLIDAARHAKVHAQATPELAAALDDAQVISNAHEHEFPDERLKLEQAARETSVRMLRNRLAFFFGPVPATHEFAARLDRWARAENIGPAALSALAEALAWKEPPGGRS